VPNKPRFVALAQRVRQLHPHLGDPAQAISDGLIRVDGVVVSNPRARVPRGAAVTIAPPAAPPRGARKLAAALRRFAVPVAGRVALDVGAAAGGFTHALLAAGARRVYAVDAGHGQLLGSLRSDGRVVNLARAPVDAEPAARPPRRDRVPHPPPPGRSVTDHGPMTLVDVPGGSFPRPFRYIDGAVSLPGSQIVWTQTTCGSARG
jgi:hypothetical protein